MQIFRGIEILGINNKYTMVDYLRRNNVVGDIMYTAAKNLDKKVKLSKEIGFDLEDNTAKAINNQKHLFSNDNFYLYISKYIYYYQ